MREPLSREIENLAVRTEYPDLSRPAFDAGGPGHPPALVPRFSLNRDAARLWHGGQDLVIIAAGNELLKKLGLTLKGFPRYIRQRNTRGVDQRSCMRDFSELLDVGHEAIRHIDGGRGKVADDKHEVVPRFRPPVALHDKFLLFIVEAPESRERRLFQDAQAK